MPDLLLDQLATAIICLDDRLHLTYMNQSAESLFSTDAKHALGCHCVEWSGASKEMLDRLQLALSERQPFSDRQLTLSWPGRGDALVDCHVSLHQAESGSPGLLLEFTQVDRHRRIAREEALMAQQEHNRMFLRGLTHEIKNPLGGLRGAAQLLERELMDDTLKDYTKVIIREADRLQKLVDDMIGPVSVPHLVALNIHDPLEHVRKIISVETQRNIKIKTDYDPSIPEFNSDRDRLTQVFLNIAINAVHAVTGENAAPESSITFKTRVINNFTLGGVLHPLMIAVRIIDTGPGIGEELIEQIFYPLVSARPGGTGLGLSIAQQTINQLGGLIECDSEPGNTVFTVLIPLELS
ncbi:MAG: PAS domain-containing protein [Gammaproteobacteria bacterium]|nr:PAS domain-containing protein [Gammaproteobacteria bacterium]